MSWRRGRTHSRTRSSAMVTDLMADEALSDSTQPSVPQWLVDQQQEHIRAARKNQPPPQRDSKKDSNGGESSKKKSSQSSESREKDREKQKSDPTDEDDFIIVDMLDGAHLPTKTPPSANKEPSSNLDSICALPPIDGENEEKWEKLTVKQAQDWRRRSRGGYSFGTYASPMPVSAPPPRRSPSPPRRPRSPVREQKAQPKTPHPPLVSHSPLARSAAPMPDKSERPHVAVDIGPASGIESAGDRTRSNKNPSRKDNPRGGDSRDELKPLLPGNNTFSASTKSTKPPRSRQGSFSVSRDHLWVDDDGKSIAPSYATINSWETRRKEGGHSRRRRQKKAGPQFEPSSWNWRMPAEEDAVMPGGAWIYLPLIGFLTFVIAYLVNDVSAWIGENVIGLLADMAGTHLGGDHTTMIVLAMLRGLSLATSFFVVLFIAPQYSSGSGIPEMKCVLSGVLMPRMLNMRTLIAKMIGLTFALASNISIGRLGPFIHMSGITAALVAKIPWFKALHTSAKFQLQALNAAMAAGVGATFGAPIGGTMLSIEIMSTYYYIHWLPMALYCSVMGYYFVICFVDEQSHAYFTATVNVVLQLEISQRLVTYIILGAICGFIGACLVRFTTFVFKRRRQYFTNNTPLKTAVMVTLFAAFHTFITYSSGGILARGQKQGVDELFKEKYAPEAWALSFWKPSDSTRWNNAIFLFAQMIIKFVLTGLSLVMPVPAGTFMPIFELGALLGRGFGEFCNGIIWIDWVDPRSTAIIGAAALTTGVLHTTSVAVVMLELTREAIDVLPLAIGVIVSYGVSKWLCSDLFSELIKIRRLPFILGLRERYPSENKMFYETVATVVAGTFMSTDFPYVTPMTTKGELFDMLTRGGKPWINCAFLSDADNRRLWGTISQKSLWEALGDGASQLSPSPSDEEVGYGSFSRDAQLSLTQNDPVPMLRKFDPNVGSPHVDMGPMQVSIHTPFWKIITYFRMLSMSTMYVMKDGVTVGTVSKAQVISRSMDIEEQARQRREDDKRKEANRKREEKDLIQKLRRDPQTSSRLASKVSERDLLDFVAASSGRRSRQGSFSHSRR